MKVLLTKINTYFDPLEMFYLESTVVKKSALNILCIRSRRLLARQTFEEV